MDTSKESLERLTKIHLARYKSRIARGLKGDTFVRVGELRRLLSLWYEVHTKGFDFDKLSRSARAEVLDALLDEEE